MKKNDNFINLEFLNDIQSYLKDKPVIKGYLFGSYARGDANESSDIDLLLELDYSKIIGWSFFAMEKELSILLGKKVDILTTESVSKFISESINKDKRLIYER
jgi:uncharacterized protein